MSTRCQILVEQEEASHPVYIYRHSDGYPDSEHGVLVSLKPLCEDFLKGRGWDPAYMIAHIVADQIKLNHERLSAYKEFSRESWYLGYGIDTVKHDDIEFLYVVKRGGIEVMHREYKRDGKEHWVSGRFVKFDL